MAGRRGTTEFFSIYATQARKKLNIIFLSGLILALITGRNARLSISGLGSSYLFESHDEYNAIFCVAQRERGREPTFYLTLEYLDQRFVRLFDV